MTVFKGLVQQSPATTVTQETDQSAAINALEALAAEMPQPVATVAALKALTGADNRLRYCVETETFYRYEATGSAYTADDLYVMITGDGGNTRWIGVAGRYVTEEIFLTLDTLSLSLTGITVSDSGGGTVTIPKANTFSDGNSITIAGDSDYNGTYTLLAASDGNNLVITHAYVAKTFGAGVTASGIPSNGTVTLTREQVTNKRINNYGQAGIWTLQFPAAGPNMSLLLVAGGTGYALHAKAGASDKHYLDGTALDDGDKVSLATPALLNCAAFFTVKTGASTWDWFCNTISGVWTDGGA